MSFSTQVKKEISSLPLTSKAKADDELLGILICGSHAENRCRIITSENKNIVFRACELISFLSNKSPDITLKFSRSRTGGKNLYTIKINNSENIPCISKNSYWINGKIETPVSVDFLRGVFLACGSITQPEKNYHLELNISSIDLCRDLFKSLENLKSTDFSPGIVKRRKNNAIYLKDSEKITDFLVLIGAKQSAMEFIQIKMVKEVRNNINRTTNFETANLSKITASSSKQIKAIKYIKNTKGLEWLPESLRETATLRLSHPYISLKELTELYKVPVSKSGVNHRLNKIVEISENLSL